MSTYTEDLRKVTTRRLAEMKQRGEKVSMLTAYDYSMASLIDQAGMDVILVGDSASNVMAGNITDDIRSDDISRSFCSKSSQAGTRCRRYAFRILSR
mgnify:CR=1 FL=1